VTVTEPAEVDDLVRRSQRGDRAAFAELFRRHRGDVSRLVFRMLGPTADAEDVVQEVFLQVHKSLGEFRGQAKFTTWLHRVTVNVVLMVRRAARSRPVFSGEPMGDHEPDRGLLPDEDASRRARLAAFRRLLDRLPEKKQTVFILHEIEGRSPADIAEMVDAPVLTVRTRLFYARRELAEMMGDEPALAQLAEELGVESKSPSHDGAASGPPPKRAREASPGPPAPSESVTTGPRAASSPGALDGEEEAEREAT
jgi:RNA polymerase sigma-70 factor (ECF subfamily)